MKTSPFRFRKNQSYYYITRYMEVTRTSYWSDAIDESLAKAGNMFPTRRQAENVLKKFQYILHAHRKKL